MGVGNVLDLLSPQVRQAAAELGIRNPTLPQTLAIPHILEGRHTLIVAPTGSGKTEAAMLPVLNGLIREKSTPGIKALYIAPLRALNRDMLKRFTLWAEKLGFSVMVRHGDTTLAERRKQSAAPPDMLITTPETLQAILPGRKFRKHLGAVRWVVVDEIHELYGDKRGAQLSLGLERLVELAGEFQRIGLSATLGDVERAGRFLVGTGRKAMIVDASLEKDMDIRVEAPQPSGHDVNQSEDMGIEPFTVARIQRLRDLIGQNPGCLVFVNTREMAEFLGSRLRAAGLPVSVHHGSLARETRIVSERRFKEGELGALVCTSSMELGLDIGRVSLVIQYSSPRQSVRMVQRIGRAGHRLGRISRGIVIATSPEDIIESAVLALRAKMQKLESEESHEEALDVLAHQIVGMLLERKNVRMEELLQIIRRSALYEKITEGKVNRVIEQLEAEKLVTRSGDELEARRRAFEYYFANLSTIPDTTRYRVRELSSGRKIALLDEEFVQANLYPQSTFVCNGETWRVIEIDNERKIVEVERHDDPMGAIPAWEGELIPVYPDVAQEVAKWRGVVEKMHLGGETKKKILEELCRRLPLTPEAAEWFVEEILQAVKEGFPVPTDQRAVLEVIGNHAVLHIPFGTRINKTLGWALGELLTAKIGASVRVRTDAYRIAFALPGHGQWQAIQEVLKELKPEHLRTVLELTLKNSAEFRWRLLQVAKRFGAIRRDADISAVPIGKLVESFAGTPVFEETHREMLTEKLDLGGTRDALRKLKQMKIHTVFRGEPSVFACYLLNQLLGGEIVMPRRAEREILQAVRHRLENRTVILFCLNCTEWKRVTRVKRIAGDPKCARCGAKLVTLVPEKNEKLIGLLKKHRQGAKLTKEELAEVARAERIASLVLTYGRKALLALSGRGVGWKTATRILAKSYRSEDDFYREILRAERTYAKTRRFWER